LIGPIFGFFAIDTQKQVQVAVHGAKATDGDREDFVEFFESLVDPFFPLETVLIGKQMGFPAASGKAVIPTTYGRIYQSEASFSHRKSPLRNIRFNRQSLPNCKTNAMRCACPFLFFLFCSFLLEADLPWLDISFLCSFAHDLTNQVIGNHVSANLIANSVWFLASQVFHLHFCLERS
jgi:hypothetical protein